MKKILLLILVVLVAAGLYFSGLLTAEENIRNASNPPSVAAFEEVATGYSHVAHAERFPFTGGAVLDVDGDGAMEIFVSGSKGQPNALLSWRDGKLVDGAEQAGLSADEASFGATSIDMDNDGDTDLLVAQHDGVWLYSNNNGRFSGAKLAIPQPTRSFPLNVAVTDLNRDGLPDLYVSNFVAPDLFVPATFNDPEHAKPNVMLLNLGGGRFEDITEQTGTAGVQNTFHATFVDLDGNGHQDLVLANNTGPIQIFENHGDLRFTEHDINSGLGFWMGLGVGDIDRDGDQDLYFSNIGSSIPAKLLRGDLRDDQSLQLELEWLLLRNDGNWQFSDITADYALDGYGFAWGGVFEDLNLDGDLDLLVAQNYINWPGHKVNKLPGKAYLQLEQDGQPGFYHLDELGLNNPHYGQSALIADVDGDGRPDVTWLNMNGAPRVLLNQSEGNFLKLAVPDNSAWLGAEFTLVTEGGNSYTRQQVANVGMASDQTSNVFFGLGEAQAIQQLIIKKRDGSRQIISQPTVNTQLQLK